MDTVDEQQPTVPETPEQPAQLQPGQAALNLSPQGLFAATVVQIGIDEEHMHQIVRDWLKLHPELANELLQTHIAQLQATKSHLALVKDPATVHAITKRGKLLN